MADKHEELLEHLLTAQDVLKSASEVNKQGVQRILCQAASEGCVALSFLYLLIQLHIGLEWDQ